MENETAVNDFLSEVKQADPFAQNVEVPAEVTPPSEPAQEEKRLSFAQDPKVQRYVQKEIAKAMKDFKPSAETEFRQEVQSTTDVDDVLVRLIGNDTPEKLSMVKEFKNVLENGTKKAKEEMRAELLAQQQKEIAEDREAEADLAEQFETVEDQFGVDLTSDAPRARKMRQEFVTLIEDIAPKNSDGEIVDYPDLVNTFKIFQAMQKSQAPSNARAKDLASRSMSRSTETSSTDAPKERVSWESLSRLMSK